MKLLILFSTILLFACASPKHIISDDSNVDNTIADEFLVDLSNSNKTDLTAEIMKFPTVYVRGLGSRASVYIKDQRCSPIFMLNGEIIQDYYIVYNTVDNEIIKSIEIIQPRQAARYGLRSTSGIILIKTEDDSTSAE